MRVIRVIEATAAVSLLLTAPATQASSASPKDEEPVVRAGNLARAEVAEPRPPVDRNAAIPGDRHPADQPEPAEGSRSSSDLGHRDLSLIGTALSALAGALLALGWSRLGSKD